MKVKDLRNYKSIFLDKANNAIYVDPGYLHIPVQYIRSGLITRFRLESNAYALEDMVEVNGDIRCKF